MYMDLGNISPLPLYLNSEPKSSCHSSENQQMDLCLTADTNFPVDLYSVPERSDSSPQNQLTNSCLPLDLNSVPESPSLLVDLNLVPENCCFSSENEQAESCFQLEVNNQLCNFRLKRKRPHDEIDLDDVIIAKRLKAAREKSRRNKLNDSFQELENVIDPSRFRSSKRIVLNDAINALKDLTSELSRMRIEQAALSEETRELMQEKAELTLEKASLKSDIEILELQFQSSLSFMLPIAQTDPSNLVTQSTSCPIIVPHAPSDPIPVHYPGLKSVPFLNVPSDTPFTKSGSTFSPYLSLVTPRIDKPSTSIASTFSNPLQQNIESKTSNDKCSKVENHRSLATELELMPGSISKKFSPRNKGKQVIEDEENIIQDGNFLNMSYPS